MKKIMLLKFFIMGLIFSSTAFSQVANVTTDLEIKPAKKVKWTYIRIVAYDSVWGEDIKPSLEEALGHMLSAPISDNIHFVTLADGNDSKESAYGFKTMHNSENKEEQKIIMIPEIDMSKPETYEKFFKWAAIHFPSEKLIVSFWGHGGGLSSVTGALGYDDSHSGLGIQFDVFSETLSTLAKEANKKTVDLLFLCTCLNGSVENSSSLVGKVDYFVAGESVVGCLLEPHEVLLKQPNISTRELAIQTVKEFQPYKMDVVYSAVDVAKIPKLEVAIKKLGSALALEKQKKSAEFDFKMRQIDREVTTMAQTAPNKGNPYDMGRSFFDLGHFTKLLQTKFNSLVSNPAKDVRQILNRDVVISKYISKGNLNLFSQAEGLSIYHPHIELPWLDLDFYSQSIFAQKTGWEKYLKMVGIPFPGQQN